jgi:chitodextrinase
MRGWILFFSLFLLVAFAGCNQNDLTSGGDRPTVTAFTPSQVTRGEQNVTGHITGTNFTGIVAVDLGDAISIHETTLVSSSAIDVVFSVSQDASPGNRTIRVSNPAGAGTNADLLTVSDNHAPVAEFNVNALQGIKGSVFNFNASASHDSDGQIQSYSWDFGDAKSGHGVTTSHQYEADGTFTVKLVITDNHQAQGTQEKNILIENIKAPIARYTVTPHGGDRDTLFHFDASNSFDPDGHIVSYHWNFRDGGSDTGKTTKHKFNGVDKFQVELTVKDNDGVESTMEREVNVRGKNPTAAFSVSPTVGDSATTFQFDAGASHDSDGRITNYSWSFGDERHDSGSHVSHKYSSEKNWSVQLTVTDDDGLEDSISKTVSVGGSGGDAEGECKVPADNRGFIYGTVIGYHDNWAVVRLPPGSTCANSFYHCGDMRRANPEQFRGIIKRMISKGDNVFEIFNDCPYRWPPAIGEVDFLYYKTCDKNFCP